VGGGLGSTIFHHDYGDDRDRTGNLRLAKPALSQLSYVPLVAVTVGVTNAPREA
jgi:hypothetical protein